MKSERPGIRFYSNSSSTNFKASSLFNLVVSFTFLSSKKKDINKDGD